MVTIDYPAILFCRNWEDLTAILEPNVNMVIYSRPANPAWAAVRAAMRGQWRATLSAAEVPRQLQTFLQQFSLAKNDIAMVLSEIQPLFEFMLLLSQQDTAQVVFSHIQNNHCRLFHADHNYLRLVCTFIGKGTEFLLNEDVNREGLGKGTNEGHIPGRPIQSLRAGEIAIMKGNLYPGNEGLGAVHRSPPLLATDTGRLFLAIDSIAAPIT